MTQTIAIFGGSFDPPHEDHARIIKWLTGACPIGFSKVIVAVVGDEHAHDKNLTPYKDRYDMTAKMIRPIQGGGLFTTSPNIKLVKQSERFTVEFLERLKAEDPEAELHLVVGADILNDTDRWERWDDVQKLASLIPISREGTPMSGPLMGFEVESRGFSSSEIRKQLAEDDLTHLIGKGGMLNRKVFDHITLKGLYGYMKPEMLEPKVRMAAVTIPFADLDKYIEAGDSFFFKGLVRKVVDVRPGATDGVEGVKFIFVYDTSKDNETYPKVLDWYQAQTEAWAKGEDFDTPMSGPLSPGIFAIKSGHPVKTFPPNVTYLGEVGDYDFFELSKNGDVFNDMFKGIF